MCQLWGQDFVNFALNPDNDGVIIEKLRRRSLLADIALCHNRSLQTIKPVSHVNDSCKVICLTIVFKRFNGLIPLSGDSSIHEILNNTSYNQQKSSEIKYIQPNKEKENGDDKKYTDSKRMDNCNAAEILLFMKY